MKQHYRERNNNVPTLCPIKRFMRLIEKVTNAASISRSLHHGRGEHLAAYGSNQQYVSHLFVPFVLDFAQLLLKFVEDPARRYVRLLGGSLANGTHTLTLDARRLGYHAVRKASSLQQVRRHSSPPHRTKAPHGRKC